jgi:hypothetical protein
MLPVKKGDNEIKRGRQKKGLLADVLLILEAEHGLSRTLGRKDIDTSELRIIHRLPQIETASPGKLQKGEENFGVSNSPER